MKNITVKIADLIIDIENVNEIGIFENYLKKDAKNVDIKLINNLNNEEYIDIHRQLAEKLANFNGFLMHGAAISHNNKAYVFIAPSGTGKTTHIKLWDKYLDDLIIINGDKPIIRQINGINYVFGSPWSGKEGLNSNIKVPLEAIIVLKRSENDVIKEINPNNYLNDIIKQIYLPKDENSFNLTINLINSVFSKTKVYELGCTLKDSAFFVSYKGLIGK